MKRWNRPMLLALVACASAAVAGASDVSGKWKAEFDTQIGVQKYVFDLTAEGEKLTGKATFERMGQQGEVELTDGKISGDEVSFVESLDFQGMPLRIQYTGTVSGDEIAFKRQVGGFATEEFTATRIKE